MPRPWRRGYDIHAGAISDLGVIPASALLFNASLIAAGVLNVVGGYLNLSGTLTIHGGLYC